MTVATVIYYSGYHPYTLEKMKTPKTKREKDEQHRFFFWYKKENQDWIRKTLTNVGRRDLADRLLPDNPKFHKNKKDFRVKNTFDDAVDTPKGKRRGNKGKRSQGKQEFVSVLDKGKRKNNSEGSNSKKRKPKRRR